MKNSLSLPMEIIMEKTILPYHSPCTICGKEIPGGEPAYFFEFRIHPFSPALPWEAPLPPEEIQGSFPVDLECGERILGLQPIDPCDFTPSPEWVEDLAPGDQAPSPFGRIMEVRNVFARGHSPEGSPFVCVYLRDPNSETTFSQSYRAGKKHITI